MILNGCKYSSQQALLLTPPNRKKDEIKISYPSKETLKKCCTIVFASNWLKINNVATLKYQGG